MRVAPTLTSKVDGPRPARGGVTPGKLALAWLVATLAACASAAGAEPSPSSLAPVVHDGNEENEEKVAMAERPLQSVAHSATASPPPAAGLASDLSGRIETAFSEDWDNWALRLGDESGSMRTRFSNSWDRWRIRYKDLSIDIDTRFSNSWDKWRIQGAGVRIDADTRFSNSWDKWNLNTTDGHLQVSANSSSAQRWLIEGAGGRITVERTSAGGQNWRVRDEMPHAAPSTKLAAIFLVVHNGALRTRVELPGAT